jgi:hypothetical protein
MRTAAAAGPIRRLVSGVTTCHEKTPEEASHCTSPHRERFLEPEATFEWSKHWAECEIM